VLGARCGNLRARARRGDADSSSAQDMENESIDLTVQFYPWASLRPSLARRLGIALLLLTNAVDLTVVSLTGSVAGACAIGVSVLCACVSIAVGSQVPGRTRIMAALATPLNLQALIIADHDNPDELLLISAARSSVLAVVAAMPLLYPPRLGSDAAIADATLGACVLCLFLSLLGVVLPSLRDVREGTSANTLSANSLGGGGLGDNIMAHATQQEGHTPPSRPRRLGGDAFRLLDPEGALPPRSRRTYLPQAGLQHHGGLRMHLSNPSLNPNPKPSPNPYPYPSPSPSPKQVGCGRTSAPGFTRPTRASPPPASWPRRCT